MARRPPKKRFGGFPPIVIVILFIAAVITAVLVAWWLIIPHRYAIQRPILELCGGVYISGSNAYFTLKNDGIEDFSGIVCIVIGGNEYCTPNAVSIPSGGRAPVTITGVSVPAGSTVVDVVIRPGDAGEIRTVAEVLRG